MDKTEELVQRYTRIMISELMTMGYFYEQTVKGCFESLMLNKNYFISDSTLREEVKLGCVKAVVEWFNKTQEGVFHAK